MGIEWDKRASAIAEVHFEDEFETKMGIDSLIGENAFYVFNNCPYRKDLTDRDRQLNELREEAAKLGIRELGYGEHPAHGADEGYSFVVMFEGGDGECRQVDDLLWRIFGRKPKQDETTPPHPG